MVEDRPASAEQWRGAGTPASDRTCEAQRLLPNSACAADSQKGRLGTAMFKRLHFRRQLLHGLHEQRNKGRTGERQKTTDVFTHMDC